MPATVCFLTFPRLIDTSRSTKITTIHQLILKEFQTFCSVLMILANSVCEICIHCDIYTILEMERYHILEQVALLFLDSHFS